MCAAAHSVAEIRDRSRRRNPHFKPNGLFDTIHIRRGDFQKHFTSTQTNTSVLDEISKDKLKKTHHCTYLQTKQISRFLSLSFRTTINYSWMTSSPFTRFESKFDGMIDEIVAAVVVVPATGT